MTDTSTPPVNPPPAPAPKPKQGRSAINKEYLAAVADARKVADAASDPAHTDGLTDVDFDDTIADQTHALADQIETALGVLTGTRAGKKEMTAQEKAARDALIAVLAPIQTAAKRKFTGETSHLREAYFIGGNNNLANAPLDEVITDARAILARLVPGPAAAPPTDLLPGIKPLGKIKDLSDAIAAYDTKNKAQGAEQAAAGTSLETIAAQIATLNALRRDIQLAADQAWPWRTPGVKTTRKAFLLPEDRPMKE